MELIPAIDLRDGKVVRLLRGDYGKETVYSSDPVAVARQFEAAGVARLHVIDLDGALAGSPGNALVCQRIAQAVRIPIQVGGGLRTMGVVEQVMAMGAERVILGTSAVSDPELVGKVVAKYGAQRVVVGLDARDGMVAVKGWTEDTPLSARELMAAMAVACVGRFIFTDIARDGTLTEPNFDAVASLVHHGHGLVVSGGWQGGPALIATGGIGTIEHLERLADIGVEGAIVGSALYTGGIDLGRAVRTLEGS